MENITLYYSQGSSDKIYQAAIEPKEGGYVVNFAFGRRGTTLQTGSKTQSPVSYDDAKVIYEKLIREKTAKGYTPGEDGTPYQQSAKEQQSTGILPQLLNPIEESAVAAFISSPAFAAQEKFDGRRLLIRKTMAGIEGINRNGLIVSLPCSLVDDAEALPGSFILDGESVGDQFQAFDLLLFDGKDIRQWAFRDRCIALINLIASAMVRNIRFVETAFDTTAKTQMLERLKTENREGVVFKRITAPYTSGRPANGSDQLKHKFYESASFIVGKPNGKRSVSLKLFDSTLLVPAGNVTIPPNHEVPKPGDVVEVRYLYAFRESGSVYQPVYLGVRDDIKPTECSVRQLKFKAELVC